MANVSFLKQMNFNKKETEALFKYLESENRSNYKVKTPAAKKASKDMLKKLFIEKKR